MAGRCKPNLEAMSDEIGRTEKMKKNNNIGTKKVLRDLSRGGGTSEMKTEVVSRYRTIQCMSNGR